jgi:predicted DNA-binding WGR domain protein
MSYPMSISRASLDHRGGTKSYHLLQITNALGQSVFVSRWGKTGAFGDVKIERGSSDAMSKAWLKKHSEKERGGYAVVSSENFKAKDLDELIKWVGRPTWTKLSADDLKHLDSTIGTNGVREAEPPRFTESGDFVGVQARKVEITEEMKEQVKLEKFEQARARNPNYGRF